MSSIVEQLNDPGAFAQTMHFEDVGDYVVGKVVGESHYVGEYGDCPLFVVRAQSGRSRGESIAGQDVRIFCRSTYLAAFVEESAPLLWDYVVLTLTALWPSKQAGYSPTKVIECVRKRRTDVEKW